MILLLLIGAALRPLFLTRRSLWFDEATTLATVRVPFSRVPGMVVRDEVAPPLYHVLMHFWLKLFADPLFGLRIFSVLCGIAALFAFRGLVERVLPQRARLLALFLAAFSSYWIHLSQDGRFYGLLLLIVVLEIRVTFELSVAPTPRLWASFAGLAAAGLWTHYYFAVILAAHVGWLAWTHRRSRRQLGRLLAASAAAALFFAPWLPSFLAQFALHRHDPGNADPLTLSQLASLFGTLFFDISFLGLVLPSWTVPALGAFFGALAAVGAVRARRPDVAPQERRALAFTLFHLAAPLALIGLVEFAAGRPVTQARFFAPLSPFAYMAAALALSAPGRWIRAPRVALELIAAAGVVGYFFSIYAVDPRFGRLAEILRAGDSRRPLVYLESYYYLPMREYYLPERTHFLFVGGPGPYGLDYRGLPTYDGLVDRARLPRLGPCVVVDPKELVSPAPYWLGTGAQLAELLGARSGAAPR